MAGSDEGGQSGTAARPVSPAQSRAARGLLGWSEADLADKAGLDPAFVRDFEGGHGDPPAGQLAVLRSALMSAGVAFTEDGTSGVRLDSTCGGEGIRADALTTENDR